MAFKKIGSPVALKVVKELNIKDNTKKTASLEENEEIVKTVNGKKILGLPKELRRTK